MLVNIQSNFQALVFLTGVDDVRDIGLFPVNPSGEETVSALRISLNFCWLPQLPACLYNFYIFRKFVFI